jgi:pyruvate oxidase
MELLIDWNIDHIYGMPGDSINSIIESLRKVEDKIKFIQIRHEENGALAASSYAKLTGKIGVCTAIAGPGAIHLLNGLYDAKLDGAPLLAICGQVESDLMGLDYFQEVNLSRLFDDVAVYNQRITSAEQLPGVINQAIRTAYAKSGVAVITISDDVQKAEVEKGARFTSPVVIKPKFFPHQQDLIKAEALLRKSKKAVILAGKGARKASAELVEFAERMASPIVLSLPGKGVIPDMHPYCLGGLGLIGTKPAYEAMKEADTLILIGTSFPFTGFLPEKARTIQIDTNPVQIGKRYPIDVGLVGEAKETLKELLNVLQVKEDQTFLESCQGRMADWWAKMEKEENVENVPIKPQSVVKALQEVTSSDAIISCDVGNVTVWMARHFRMTNQKFVISSWLATLGCGLPGAIAGKIAYPSRQVVAVCGDGGFTMTMNDFVTAVKYDLPMMVIILNNHKIAMIKFEQEVMGNAEFGTNLHNPNFAKYAESCGGVGFRVEKPKDLMPTLKKAALQSKPCIVDVVVDANEAPLPSNLTFSQAKGYAQHMIKELFSEGKLDLPPL